MSKKANAIVLTLVVIAAIGIAAILIQLQFSGSPTATLSPGQVQTETKLLLENSITRGVMNFMNYGYSRYDLDTFGDKGTPAWFCNDGYAPPIDESDRMLKNHIIAEVRLAIERFNEEHTEFEVSWGEEIEVPDTQDGVADRDDLPEETFTVILKKITIRYTDENGDYQTQSTDITFSKQWRVWSIYNTLYKWTDEDIGDLKQKIVDLVEEKECKNRLCTCGSTNLDDWVEEMSVKREDVESAIEEAIAPLQAEAASKNLECEYTLVHLNVYNNAEYDGKQLAPILGDFEIVPWTDWYDKGECAVGPYQSECSGDDSNIPDDITSASPHYGEMPKLGSIYHSETSPDSTRCSGIDQGNCGCPVPTGTTSPKVITRPIMPANPSLSHHHPMASGPAIDDRGAITGPRIDQVGIHKHVSVLISVNCKSTDEYFETPSGNKPLASNALFMVSVLNECEPPEGEPPESPPKGICADGDCINGGVVVAAGAEWLDILGQECDVDLDCAADDVCFACVDCEKFSDPDLPQKCCALRGTVKTALDDPAIKFCGICYRGEIGACIIHHPDVPGGDFPCGAGQDGSGAEKCGKCICDGDKGACVPNTEIPENTFCKTNKCGVCDVSGDVAACVPFPGGACNNICGTCDDSGGCTISTGRDGESCGTHSCADMVCSGSSCIKDPASFGGYEGQSCGTSSGGCGQTTYKICSNGNCVTDRVEGGCSGGQTCCGGTCCDPAACCGGSCKGVATCQSTGDSK